MPLILNIESSTEICSICISKDSEVLASVDLTEKFKHSEMMTLLIERCVKQVNIALQNIDAVAIGSGPGSYTSLRVGASVAKGICYALDKPLICVNTLQALANGGIQQFQEEKITLVRPTIDARRMEIYTQLFDENLHPHSEAEAVIVEGNSFDENFEKGVTLFCGNGAEKLKDILQNSNSRFLPMDCSAKYMIPFSEQLFLAKKFENIANYEPFYLKPPNITVSNKTL